MLCRQQVAELSAHLDLFAEKNSKLVVISSGAYSHIKEFREVTRFKGTLLTDPSRKAFEQLGFSSSIGGLFGLKTFAKGFSALRQGIKPGLLQGSALQLGGAVIINKAGNVLYQFHSTEAGEDPPLDEIFAALD